MSSFDFLFSAHADLRAFEHRRIILKLQQDLYRKLKLLFLNITAVGHRVKSSLILRATTEKKEKKTPLETN